MVRWHLAPTYRDADTLWFDRQREDEKHRKREEKDAARREDKRRKREQAEERELRQARERDKQAQYQQSQQQQSQYRAGVGRVSPYSAPGTLPRAVSPSPYQGGGQLPSQRPVSPYQSGGALPNQRPVSPYHGGGQLPSQRPVSPYHGGGQLPSQRPVSPYHGAGQLPSQRPVSPYHGGGQLPSQRPVSPYHSGGALPSQRPVSPYHGGGALPSHRQVSPYHSGGGLPNTKPVSPYHSGGVLPGTKPVSPYHGGGNLPGTSPSYYTNPNYGSAYSEAERKMGDLGIGGKASEYHSRKKSTGYQAAPGGDYPPGTPGSHYTTTTTVPSQSPYHSTTPIQPQSATRDPYNRGPSPSPYSTPAYQPPQLQNEAGMLAPPEGFSRPPNAAQSYTKFETIKIQDMDDLMESMPRMPVVLGPHDVYHPDWIRFMQDLTNAWLGRLPVPESAKQDGRPPKRSIVATDLVELWNASFFIPRGVELIVYKGRERRNGKYAGSVDTDLQGFDITADDITDSSSELTEQDSEDAYIPPGGARYGNTGGVYGRQDASAIEAQQARARRKEIEHEERRKRKEKQLRRRLRELERKYTLYLTCLPAPGYA